MRIGAKYVGKLLSVRFLDHAIGGDVDVVECEAVGKVVGVDKLSIRLEYWSVHTDDLELETMNRERVVIVQSTIISFIEWAAKDAKRFT